MHLFDDRVQVDPEPVKAGGKARITYNGLLAKSGADQVYLHYGVDGWKRPQTVYMDKIGDRFQCEVKTTATVSKLDFCFKDSADHWDNNGGLNWRVDVI
ncbi:MAG: carbohydrate-binding protein [Patescibacteria group bacterium]